jgi:hypothetical protein
MSNKNSVSPLPQHKCRGLQATNIIITMQELLDAMKTAKTSESPPSEPPAMPPVTKEDFIAEIKSFVDNFTRFSLFLGENIGNLREEERDEVIEYLKADKTIKFFSDTVWKVLEANPEMVLQFASDVLKTKVVRAKHKFPLEIPPWILCQFSYNPALQSKMVVDWREYVKDIYEE